MQRPGGQIAAALRPEREGAAAEVGDDQPLPALGRLPCDASREHGGVVSHLSVRRGL